MFIPLFFFRQPPPPFVRETEPEPEPAPTPTPSPRAAAEEPEDTADLRNKVQKLEEEVQQVRCHWEMSWDIRLSLVTLMLAWELAFNSTVIQTSLSMSDPSLALDNAAIWASIINARPFATLSTACSTQGLRLSRRRGDARAVAPVMRASSLDTLLWAQRATRKWDSLHFPFASLRLTTRTSYSSFWEENWCYI